MNSEFELFPEAASKAAGSVDALYLFMVALSVVITVAIASTLIYFAVKYRRDAVVNREQHPTSITRELTWIAAALPVLILIFVWGAKVCFELLKVPDGAMPITVVAKQWMWKFQHADGRREIDVLHVPVGRPIALTMISQDVIHSFYVPAFRVKQDVLPGRYTTLWFEATKPGDYRLYCAEYCGTNHSKMIGKIVAQSPEDFSDWLAGKTEDDASPISTGERLFAQFQCASCHDRMQGPNRAPSLAGIFGKTTPLANGDTATIDEQYIRESILRPASKVVAGFQPIMPPYEGQIGEEHLLELIAYIKSLKNPEDGASL